MSRIIIHLLSVCVLFNINIEAQSIAEETPLNQSLFSNTMLLQHIQTLSSDSFEGRRTGTKGATKAKRYIINQFHSLNVLPFDNTYEQTFSFVKERKHYNATNILGFIKGSDFPKTYVVISAHYDHEGIKMGRIYNGADDDASGISALFSFAEYFKSHPPKHSVILAAFDAEELGLKGSEYFVNNSVVPLKNIKVNLNMDMISRSDNKELFVVGTRHNKTLNHLILETNTSEKIKLLIGHDGLMSGDDWTHSSDHASFHKKGIPFLYFGVEDHEDYHTPNDDFENIHPEFYKEAVHTIISVFKKIDGLKL